MTGFGAGNATNDAIRIDVEVKTVNNRFLDVILRIPRSYSAFEPELKSFIGQFIERGRCEVTVTRQVLASAACNVALNYPVLSAYFAAYLQAAEENSLDSADFRERALLDVLNRRDVLEVLEDAALTDAEKSLLFSALEAALNSLVAMRQAEGRQLFNDLVKRLKNLKSMRKQLAKLLHASPSQLQKRLSEKLAVLTGELQLDAERLATEVAVMADRLDVSEELVRLESHFSLFEETLSHSGTGRKLEFLLQEIGREFNTVGSKAQNAKAQQIVVDAKAEMEKIREQLQNIA